MSTVIEQHDPAGTTSDAERGRLSLFKWSSWVHIGEGADECPKRFERCPEEGHFHAWIRLPNPYQHRDIQEKAAAARARRLRALRDPESDPRVILEDELADIGTEADKEIIVAEILDRDFPEDFSRAMREVSDIDDPDAPAPEEGEAVAKLYANIEQDREEYQRQRDLAEEERIADFETLRATVDAYSRAVEEHLEAIQTPRREHLMGQDVSALVDIIRRERMELQATEAFLHTYNTWQMFVCTFKPKLEGTPNERVWKDMNYMRLMESTEVIQTVQQEFRDLENRQARSRAGKGS